MHNERDAQPRDEYAEAVERAAEREAVTSPCSPQRHDLAGWADDGTVFPVRLRVPATEELAREAATA